MKDTTTKEAWDLSADAVAVAAAAVVCVRCIAGLRFVADIVGALEFPAEV
jgi:hypothetical protein